MSTVIWAIAVVVALSGAGWWVWRRYRDVTPTKVVVPIEVVVPVEVVVAAAKKAATPKKKAPAKKGGAKKAVKPRTLP